MALPARFTVEPIWTGCTAIVCASGPSLSTKQIRQIVRARLEPGSTFRIIAVNDAIYPLFGVADHFHACDWQFFQWNIQQIHKFPGIKTTMAEDVPAPWVTGYLKNTGSAGFDPDPSCCRTGGSSGYQAMCIATHAGARRIILVGMDMRNDPATEESHFFGEHPDKVKTNFQSAMLPFFPALKLELDARGVEVVNASPNSALRDWPLVDLKDALSQGLAPTF